MATRNESSTFRKGLGEWNESGQSATICKLAVAMVLAFVLFLGRRLNRLRTTKLRWSRFTKKDSSVYAILLGKPKVNTVTIKSLSPVGAEGSLDWPQQGDDIKVNLPSALPGEYAYFLKIAGPVS